MTEISNYIRNQFTEVHICKQGGCNYLENTCKVVVLLSRYVSAHAVVTNTLIDMTTRPNYQITEVHDCKVVGLNCRWPGDHLRDARWFRRNPGILCPLIDSPAPAPPPQVATPPPPRPRPGTGGGHQPREPSLGCTKVRRGPPLLVPPPAAPRQWQHRRSVRRAAPRRHRAPPRPGQWLVVLDCAGD